MCKLVITIMLRHVFRKIGVKKASNNTEYYTINLPTDVDFKPRDNVEIIPATYDGRNAVIIAEVATQPCGIVSKPHTTTIENVQNRHVGCSLVTRHTPATDTERCADRGSNPSLGLSSATPEEGIGLEGPSHSH